MSDRAVISLQLGHYANFVGAHFWNLQESSFVYVAPKEGEDFAVPKNEICHDILYREGQTLNRDVTYTPRLVSVDLKGSLGGLPEFGDLYFDRRGVPRSSTFGGGGQDESVGLWDGDLVVQKEEPRRKNDFQREMDGWENRAEVRHTKSTNQRPLFICYLFLG